MKSRKGSLYETAKTNAETCRDKNRKAAKRSHEKAISEGLAKKIDKRWPIRTNAQDGFRILSSLSTFGYDELPWRSRMTACRPRAGWSTGQRRFGARGTMQNRGLNKTKPAAASVVRSCSRPRPCSSRVPDAASSIKFANSKFPAFWVPGQAGSIFTAERKHCTSPPRNPLIALTQSFGATHQLAPLSEAKEIPPPPHWSPPHVEYKNSFVNLELTANAGSDVSTQLKGRNHSPPRRPSEPTVALSNGPGWKRQDTEFAPVYGTHPRATGSCSAATVGLVRIPAADESSNPGKRPRNAEV